MTLADRLPHWTLARLQQALTRGAGALSPQELEAVTAEAINIRGDIDTTGGSTGEVTFNGPVLLGGQLASGASLNYDAGIDDGGTTWYGAFGNDWS